MLAKYRAMLTEDKPITVKIRVLFPSNDVSKAQKRESANHPAREIKCAEHGLFKTCTSGEVESGNPIVNGFSCIVVISVNEGI